jgi:hypothetical protein
MLTAGPWDQFPRWRRSRRRLTMWSVLRCPDLWLQCSVSFVEGFKKHALHKNNVFFKPCTKLTLHCNHRPGHLKTEHAGSLPQLQRHLGNRSHGPTLSMRSELL